MGFKQLIAGALIGLVSCGTFAAPEWKFIGDTNGIFVFIDTNSISQVSEYGYQANKKFWSKQYIAEDLLQDGLAVGDYRMALTWVNCDNRTLGTKSVTLYKKLKNGAVDNKSESYSYVEMSEVVPNSIGDNVVNIVCS